MAALVGFLRRNDGQRRRLRRPRDFRDRINPLEIRTDHELFERYRFRRATIIFICDMNADTLSHRTRRSMALPPMLQLLVFLRFVATSAFHQLIGDAVHVSKATAGRCIWRVASAIADAAGRLIRFPTGQRVLNVKRKFHAIAGKNSPAFNHYSLLTKRDFHIVDKQ